MQNDPVWLAIARKYVGTKEGAGPANSPTIMSWAKRLGSKVLGIVYNADSVPWCGLFAALIMAEAGLPSPKIAVRASSWDAWGVPAGGLYLGAMVRFQRQGGGHIASLTGVSADGKFFRVIGGNQSDAVTETWIEAVRCVAIRWPAGVVKPAILAPIISRTGAVSINER